MPARDTNPAPAPEIVALGALTWILSDDDRAARLLALTGLAPDDLRARAGEAPVLAECLRFLEAYEPDLVACSAELDMAPAALVGAREALER